VQSEYDSAVPKSDLETLPEQVQASARVEANGEVCWPLSHVAEAINALADAHHIVLGLDVRDYDDDGAFVEVAWSVFEPTGRSGDVDAAREHALSALLQPELPGSWFVVTW
jgi:hypothetical protein